MLQLIVKLAVGIIFLPLVLLVAIPLSLIKVQKAKTARRLFTSEEQSLLAKAQTLMNIEPEHAYSIENKVVEVAVCIENARISYQIMCEGQRVDKTFSEYVTEKLANDFYFTDDWFEINRRFHFSSLNIELQNSFDY